MIDETRKKDNHDFGLDVVQAAKDVRDKKELKNTKKDFLGEHNRTIKNWAMHVGHKTVCRRLKEV